MKPYVIALVMIISFSFSPLLVAFIAEGLAYISGCRASWDHGAICPPATSLIGPFDANALRTMQRFSINIALTFLIGAALFVAWLIAIVWYAISRTCRTG
ncbi:hypothetical protein, partial [Sinorhizobium fredii]|uniref:hypothetical protein n=1 Tax=Rhizobium fredii TaxID=380 RepID=UPI001AEDB2EE